MPIIMTLSVPERAKVSAKRYVELLLPRLKNASCLLPSGFIFQQARLLTQKVGSRLDCHQLQWIYWQRWMAPNSPDVNPLESWLSRMGSCARQLYKTFHPQPKNTDGLKKVLQIIRDQLPQDSVNKAILSFTKNLRACVKTRVDILNVLRDL